MVCDVKEKSLVIFADGQLQLSSSRGIIFRTLNQSLRQIIWTLARYKNRETEKAAFKIHQAGRKKFYNSGH